MIVAVRAESALGHEADSLPVIIDRARWLRHKVAEIVADAGYASAGTYAMLAERAITGFIPPQPNMRHTDHGQAARERCKTPNGVGAAIDRITHGEGAIAEMKRHGAGRARCRGTRKVQIQLLLAATAINLKRLINQRPAAENATAGDDHAQSAALNARNARTGARSPRSSRSSTPASAPSTRSTPRTEPFLRQASRVATGSAPSAHVACRSASGSMAQSPASRSRKLPHAHDLVSDRHRRRAASTPASVGDPELPAQLEDAQHLVANGVGVSFFRPRKRHALERRPGSRRQGRARAPARSLRAGLFRQVGQLRPA